MHVPILPDQDDTPPALGWFEKLWTLAINISGILAFLTLGQRPRVFRRGAVERP